jgi:hypothetical protein
LVKRYRLRLGGDGWTVYDVWTGQDVRFEGGQVSGLQPQAAETLANVLNWRSRRGDRKVFQ